MDYQEIDNWQSFPQLKSLLDLSTPPKQLYFSGTLDLDIFKNCVAVVGSRRMTGYGQSAIERVIPPLVTNKQTVISGFMYGVDQYTHQVAIESGGTTIAVLGWGIDTKLTGTDLQLAEKIIASGGLMISEWKTQKPAHWTFPARNRIVAALSREVIIVEAAEKSGSLITAALAAKLKRKLWAVPGPITSRTSKGTNRLIAIGRAKMWLGETREKLIETDDPILDVLSSEALTADDVARKLECPISEVGAKLSLLTLSGQITEKGGKYYLAHAD